MQEDTRRNIPKSIKLDYKFITKLKEAIKAEKREYDFRLKNLNNFVIMALLDFEKIAFIVDDNGNKELNLRYLQRYQISKDKNSKIKVFPFLFDEKTNLIFEAIPYGDRKNILEQILNYY